MPQYNRNDLEIAARNLHFTRDTFEKVLRLKTILDWMNAHEFLRAHLLLKGGTAINLTVFKLPRLFRWISYYGLLFPEFAREKICFRPENYFWDYKGIHGIRRICFFSCVAHSSQSRCASTSHTQTQLEIRI
jgi:hypothetical protein